MDYVKEITAYVRSTNLLKTDKEQDEQGHDDEHRNESDRRQAAEGSNGDPYEYFDTFEQRASLADTNRRSIGFVEDDRLEGTTAHHSNALRSGQRLNRAKPDHVENYDRDEQPYMSNTEKEKIRAKHIINIFIDEKKMMEVTPEQLYRVRMMHKKFEEASSFSFNFNTLLMVASILAGLGLVSNSSTTIIASMLVSPLMGPVVGSAYATSIRDWKLLRKSLFTETVSLLYCILAGFVIGCLTGPTELSDDWPTNEMSVRGTMENFYVALPIAFVSGLGVAVSLLDDQTSSLVGVAISASLLPPAVNAGLLCIAYVFVQNDVGEQTSESESQYVESGVVSLCLTLANIFLIWLSGMLMFRIKEVLPIQKKVFWEDLGIARTVYTHRAVLSSENYKVPAESGINNEETKE